MEGITMSWKEEIKKKIVDVGDCPECGEKHNGDLKYRPKYDKIMCGKCDAQHRQLYG
tara:strand:+ start:1040 stop:1210 length:171 start_codon:yes stop_codon:yes gene_type:complete